MPILIDSHSHFDDVSFDDDRDAAYQRARAAGVEAQVLAAVSARLWPKLRAVAARYPGLYPSYGLHPAYLTEHRPEHLDALADWVVREKPVAIGEIGLDYYLPDLDAGAQADYFTGQLRLARRHDLPVIVHAVTRWIRLSSTCGVLPACAGWCTASPVARTRPGGCSIWIFCSASAGR